MVKQFFLKSNYVLFFALIVVMISCNNGSAAKNSADKSAINSSNTTSPTQPVVMQAPLTPPSGKLDILCVIDSLFFKLPKNKKVIFSFTFGQLDTLTLHGWSAKNDPKQFSDIPDICLVKDFPSPYFTYGPGTYFGNITLNDRLVDSFKTLLKPIDPKNVKYVLFIPVDSPYTGLPKQLIHLRYEVKVVDSNLIGENSVKINLKTPNMSALANPSPPKNYPQ